MSATSDTFYRPPVPVPVPVPPFRFPYSAKYTRQIVKSDGTWAKITFNETTSHSPFSVENQEHIHRAFLTLYYRDAGFKSFLDGGAFSIGVTHNFHQSAGETYFHINFKCYYGFSSANKDDRTFHAYFNDLGEIIRLTCVTEFLSTF